MEKKREVVFARDKYKCQQCKSKAAIHVHHLTYENIFNENLEDLISLCIECHSQIHYEMLLNKITELKEKK
ncbi:HNH endonuclease [Chryseobacterium artocarpi]|uniref:HNH endonuclease n=1 Tax=Chryseobacterium artocarpi TaxID=1414727 RepID=UPI000F4D8BDC